MSYIIIMMKLIIFISQYNITFSHIDFYGMILNVYKIKSLNKYEIMNNSTQKIKDSVFYINFL